jgi:hypothetical protein
VIVNSQERPLAQDSVWVEGWERDFVLIKLVESGIDSIHVGGKLEMHRPDTGEPQPFVVEPVVNLNDPKFVRRATSDESSQQ